MDIQLKSALSVRPQTPVWDALAPVLQLNEAVAFTQRAVQTQREKWESSWQFMTSAELPLSV